MTNDVWSSTLTSIPASTSVTLASQADGLTVNKSILPTASNQYSLGSQAYPFKDLYLDTNSVFMGGVKVLSYDPVTTSLVANVPIESQMNSWLSNPLTGPVDAQGQDIENMGNILMAQGGFMIAPVDNDGGLYLFGGLSDFPGLFLESKEFNCPRGINWVFGTNSIMRFYSDENSFGITNTPLATISPTGTNMQINLNGGSLINANVNSALTSTNTFNSLLMLSNNAIMWDDMLSSAQAAFQSGASDINNNDTLGGKLFLTSATTSAANDHLTFTFQTPHRRKSGSDLKPHIHFWQSAADQTNCWFGFYTFTSLGSTNEIEVQIGPAVNELAFTSSNMHQLAAFPDIPGTGKGISSILRFKLYRFGARGSGSITVTDCDCHYQVDGFGSEQPSSKSY
jgi:hypothetical protein